MAPSTMIRRRVTIRVMQNYCSKCNEAVYFAEAVQAMGRAFHKKCFTCSKDNCSRSLDRGTCNEHEGKPYCTYCYKSMFGPKGVGFGIGAGVLSTATQETQNDSPTCHTIEKSSPFTSVISYGTKESPFTSTISYGANGISKTTYSEKTNIPPVANGTQVSVDTKTFTRTPLASAKNEEHFPDLNATTITNISKQFYQPSLSMVSDRVEDVTPVINSPSPAVDAPKQTFTSRDAPIPRVKAPFAAPKPSSCHKCGKTVYDAEKILAAGSAWHKTTCFTCGHCNKRLESRTLCERDGSLYCNACYARNYGPRGYGHGVGAGILQLHQ